MGTRCVTLRNNGMLPGLSDVELDQLRNRLRFKVRYEVGFACPDVDDLVQESLIRFIGAVKGGKIHNMEMAGSFLNGICRNVIHEYRRRSMRDGPMPENPPDQAEKGLPEAELFELREAIHAGMEQLSSRDQLVLRAFYLEEVPKSEILASTGLSDENFRVIMSRAKARFREIYRAQVQHRAVPSH